MITAKYIILDFEQNILQVTGFIKKFVLPGPAKQKISTGDHIELSSDLGLEDSVAILHESICNFIYFEF